ncbi:hypothetical protein [Niastella yeongjuensis]|uniref:hypothetical protein n=1 Tax=Niastella yeongjuensis TaxID=354355 RepID=UPI0015A72047|nr:hypothetical protein [Niastella yeongjuensis]
MNRDIRICHWLIPYKADSVKFTNSCDTAELIIENPYANRDAAPGAELGKSVRK